MSDLPASWDEFLDGHDYGEQIRPIVEDIFLAGLKYALGLPEGHRKGLIAELGV